jgi:Tfp pilus assembly protein PilO
MLTKTLQRLRPTPAIIHAIGGATLLGAGLAFYLGFYVPAAADIQERNGRMEQLHLLMGTSEKVSRDYRALDERLTALRQSAASARKRMPRRTSTEAFIENITQLATVEGLEMELCSASGPQTLDTHTQVEVTCRLNGSYASVCRFLADVDQLSQISKVSSFQIDSTLNSGRYPIQLTFQLYYRAQLHDTEQRRTTP